MGNFVSERGNQESLTRGEAAKKGGLEKEGEGDIGFTPKRQKKNKIPRKW